MNLNDIKPISESEARELFNVSCLRCKQEYRGQSLGIFTFGNIIDLLYMKENGNWGYLTSTKFQK